MFKRDKVSPIGDGILAGVLEVGFAFILSIFLVGSQTFLQTPHPWLVVFGIVAFLCLIVISAAISAVLVLGWPFYYFLEKKYREALQALAATLITMFVFFAIMFLLVSLLPFAA